MKLSKKTREVIELYNLLGISKGKILIKIASICGNIRATKMLEKDGIHCNLKYHFSIVQTIACAEASVKIMSSFVERILDWHKKCHRGI